jgi:NADPH2:quinone reductase
MRKIVVHNFGDATVMQIETADKPTPAANRLLIRISAVGVNPVDTYIRSGTYGKLPTLPYTPGFDAAGTVLSIGNEIASHSVGDRVYLNGSVTGTYADLALCTSDQVFALPDVLSFAQGAAVGIPYATAWRAIFQIAKAQPGQTILIRGASGGVGLAATQMSRNAGLRVIGTAGSITGKILVTHCGADLVVDHAEHDEVMHFTNDRGPDIILEMMGNANLEEDLAVAARNATIVIVGNRGKVTIDPRVVMSKELEIRGVLLFATPPHELLQIHTGLAPGLRLGVLQPVVGREFSLDEAGLAHENIMQGNTAGKCVLLP